MPDGGYRSLGKVYNDVWMQEHGFLEDGRVLTAGAIAGARASNKPLVSVPVDTTLDDAIEVMREHAISQVPVTDGDDVVGSLIEQDILNFLIGDPDARARLVRDLMGPPFPVVSDTSSVQTFASGLSGERPAVLVRQGDGTLSILTRSDLIGMLGA
jgi:cystathionine beta-synthase